MTQTILNLEQLLLHTRHTDSERHLRTNQISDELFETSRYLSEPNFKTFHPDDVRRLFDLYDEHFFGQLLGTSLNRDQITFRISRRMTRAGGKTTCWTPRNGNVLPRYEIAVSSTLLFETFGDFQRDVRVTGVTCHHRLDALMRIMEHELVHLCEMLVWKASSCSKAPFQAIAGRLFGHTDHRHDLVSPREKAAKQFGLKVGSQVQFEFEGRRYAGTINRVTKRATVLVRDPKGQRYSDGHRYSKFYIPVTMLKVIDR